MEGPLMHNHKRMWALLGVVAAMAAVAASLASSAGASHKAGPTLVIWTDANRAPAVTKVANAWAASNGATIQVVTKNFGDIETQLGTVTADTAPDVVLAAHDWTGQLAANGLVVPLYPSAAVKKQFPSYTLNAFSYGTAVKKLYGIPVQVENIGLLVNTKLAKVPTTWNALVANALKWKKAHHLSYGLCVQQGSGGDAYHMYPFFAGLGGYVFGTNSAGNLDPSNIGVANKAFLKNAGLIDKWNKEGLITRLSRTTPRRTRS
jgi:arabinogalactan oligomer/maltooligosaccharide transport system substrate-binding protein